MRFVPFLGSALSGFLENGCNEHFFSAVTPDESPDMFTGTTHLTIRRPSPTTISYTVSNARQYRTYASRLFLYCSVILRIFTGLASASVLLTKYFCVTFEQGQGQSPRGYCMGWPSVIQPGLVTTAVQTRWRTLLPISAILLILCFRRFHTGMLPP
jgi:hypothetical protein